ncbi:hypothetical protein [Cerasicoccus fimbriatus]|uniref:hypothetical protein n=1 Tax=Cerasicoccus fimbriatus TaxID=3014554 RepID=UPI0022B4B0EA|nr:hypothetical protein [Cerasicoccus sp. TK19100]
MKRLRKLIFGQPKQLSQNKKAYTVVLKKPTAAFLKSPMLCFGKAASVVCPTTVVLLRRHSHCCWSNTSAVVFEKPYGVYFGH